MISRAMRDGVSRLGLTRPALSAYRALTAVSPRTLVGNARIRRQGADDGLPIPPSDLVFLVAGTTDVEWFLRGGSRAATSITDAMRARGLAMDELGAILDFGCGCGRVLRNWHSLAHAKVYGSDINPRLVEWSRVNLPFAEVGVNPLLPPLAYTDNQFDLVYALSVFTHFTAPLQRVWMDELSRIVKPGGHLAISAHGDAYIHRLTSRERKRYEAGELVVKNDTKSPGSNACSAYHPFAYVRDHLATGLELVSFHPVGAKGNPQQDLYLLRKPARTK